MKSILVLVAILCVVDAHVVLSYIAGTGPVRNAAGASKTKPATTNGQASTDGPCGGATSWGTNGATANHAAGDTVTMTINYSGGHADPSNVFKPACACSANGPTQGNMITAAKIAGVSVAAPNGESSGPYSVTFPLPTTLAGKCTCSLMDQRNWGGCVDLNIAVATTAAPAAQNGGAQGDAAGSGGGISSPAAAAGISITVLIVVGVVAVVLFMAYKGIGPLRNSALHRKMAGGSASMARPSSSSNQSFAQPAYTEEGYSAPASTPGRPMSNRAPPSAPVSSRPPPQSVRAAPVSSRPPPGRNF